MHFYDKAHEDFFCRCVIATHSERDRERMALFYVLGLTSITRNAIESLYDFAENHIKLSGLHEGWQTGTTMRICRLAFNLYGYTGDGEDDGWDYTPYNLFDTSLVDYMLEGVRLRYSPNIEF